MRILIVDDHAVSRHGLRGILGEAFNPVTFGEGETAAEALQQIHSQPWDVVVLDLSLPDGSGLDVIKDAEFARPRMPILVLSMHGENQFASRAFKAGAAGYVTKETAPETIVAAVRRVLDGGTYVSPALAEGWADRLRRGGPAPPHESLSDREYHVFVALASGKSVSAIAGDLSLSVKTVSTYRSRVLSKMALSSNADLARYAVEHGLLT